MKETWKRIEVDEFLSRELKRAGYAKVELNKTPLGTRVVIYASKPGIVIGRRGQSIRDLTQALETNFSIENPQLSVAAIEAPDLDPKVVGVQITSALARGVHFRRACYWAIRKIMEAGAMGAEIVVSGKLTTERSRSERYRSGYIPRVGDPVLKQMKTAVVDIQLKQGLFGVKVKILLPGAEFPDRPVIKEEQLQSLKEETVAKTEIEVAEKTNISEESSAETASITAKNA